MRQYKSEGFPKRGRVVGIQHNEEKSILQSTIHPRGRSGNRIGRSNIVLPRSHERADNNPIILLLEWFAFLFPQTITERRSRRAVVVEGGRGRIDRRPRGGALPMIYAFHLRIMGGNAPGGEGVRRQTSRCILRDFRSDIE